VAFGLLHRGGDLTGWPYARRGAALEALFTERGLAAPCTLCPSITDPAGARECRLPAAEHRPDRTRQSLQSRLITTVTTRTIEYAADGLTMIGHLALPAAVDRRPAVRVGPEGVGLSDVERRRTDALAELGYVALAFDLHGGRYVDDPEEMLARCLPLLADPDRMRGIGHAALDVLRAEQCGPAPRGGPVPRSGRGLQALAAGRPAAAGVGRGPSALGSDVRWCPANQRTSLASALPSNSSRIRLPSPRHAATIRICPSQGARP
jgi:hypothetical protein